MSANDGGPKHYKRGAIQAWDFIVSNELGFLEGNVVKYVTRHKEKGGVEDLRKAMHYLQKLIEVHTPKTVAGGGGVGCGGDPRIAWVEIPPPKTSQIYGHLSGGGGGPGR